MTLVYEERATADAGDPDKLWQVARRAHDDLDLPEGYRAEIIEGKIVVAASPFFKHAHIVMLVRERVSTGLPSGYHAYDMVTLEEPEGGRYIPDLGVWPDKLMDTEDDRWVAPGRQCIFALEVTSPAQEDRDYAKAAGYARCAIPVYLLVDRKQRLCVLHAEPEGSQYKNVHSVPFGEPVTVFLGREIRIDTSLF